LNARVQELILIHGGYKPCKWSQPSTCMHGIEAYLHLYYNRMHAIC